MPDLETPESQIRADIYATPETDAPQRMDHPLRSICTAWTEKIRLASEFKKKKFQEDKRHLCPL